MHINGWKILGLVGTAMFAARWGIQFLAARKAGRSVVPVTFWIASLLGSLLLVAYFSISPHRDIVGLLGNAFPATVSTYNLWLITRNRARRREGPTANRPALDDGASPRSTP